MTSWWLMLLTDLAWLYAGAQAVYLLWVRLNLPRPWWLKAFSTVSLWVFLPAPALLLAVPFVPSLSCRISFAAGACLYIWHYGQSMVPACRPRLPPGRADLRVMTANLLKGNLCAAEIVEMIEAESPDVVALQELKPGHIQAIERHLGEAYPYRDLHPGEDCEGIGLLSRYPFTSLELCEVAPGANPTQVARLLIEEHVTWVVNVHARIPRPRVWRVAGIPILHGYDTRERSEDIVGLARLVEGLPGDAILLGDHNTTPECQEYGLIPRRWHDAFREAGWGPGFTFPVKVNLLDLPMPFPLFRIDYVFYTGAWRATRARTGTMPGSDHRYVIVELV